MDYLKISAFYFIVGVLTLGCATSYYKIHQQEGSKVELEVTPDRVTLECEKLENGNYGFMIKVLDDKNTVLTAAGRQLDKALCDEHFTKIGKILNSGRQIFVAGMGDVDEPRSPSKFSSSFPLHGTFPDNERTLHFMYIWNESGLCFGAYRFDEKPCPRDEFPIR